jgi:hypothetical protein
VVLRVSRITAFAPSNAAQALEEVQGCALHRQDRTDRTGDLRDQAAAVQPIAVGKMGAPLGVELEVPGQATGDRHAGEHSRHSCREPSRAEGVGGDDRRAGDVAHLSQVFRQRQGNQRVRAASFRFPELEARIVHQ